MPSSLIIQTDGGARGNPGPAGIGLVVLEGEKVLYERGEYVGEKTNNEAEYLAFLHSLKWVSEYAAKHAITTVAWKLDSKLVVEQLNKRWKIKEARLHQFAQEIWQELAQLPCPYTIRHVYREQNRAADQLVNQALDEISTTPLV